MAVSRVKTSSILQGFPKSRSLLAGNAAYDPAATFLIQRQTAVGGEASISFTSIPQTYKHLQIRGTVHDNYATDKAPNTGFDLNFQFNSDSATNYSNHYLYGNGSTAVAAGAANSSIINLPGTNQISTANYVSALIIDVQDYANTSKYKTVRTFCGADANGTGTTNRAVALNSGSWRSTSAVTTIQIFAWGTGFQTGTTFALYGMVG